MRERAPRCDWADDDAHGAHVKQDGESKWNVKRASCSEMVVARAPDTRQSAHGSWCDSDVTRRASVDYRYQPSGTRLTRLLPWRPLCRQSWRARSTFVESKRETKKARDRQTEAPRDRTMERWRWRENENKSQTFYFFYLGNSGNCWRFLAPLVGLLQYIVIWNARASRKTKEKEKRTRRTRPTS